MNPLDRYPRLRAALYDAQWFVNLILGAIGVTLTFLGNSPLWYVITTAVFNFVWTYAGITAKGNVETVNGEVGEHDADVEPEYEG